MADKSGIILIAIIIIVAGIYVLPQIDFSKFSILPELDNRLNYIDKKEDMSQLIRTAIGGGNYAYENDKITAIASGNGRIEVRDDIFWLDASGCPAEGGGGSISSEFKKDFSRLKSYFRVLSNNGQFFIGKQEIPLPDNRFVNIEVLPDNLNLGIYDIFIDGEHKIKANVGSNKLGIVASAASSGCSVLARTVFDYIKYVPIESFTIKNDEVWVKETRGSDYSVRDLNWEMIGYHSEIRPATIRDLTAQTEIPTPQIYINLINGLPVNVASNTVHTFYYKTKWVEGLDSSCQGQLDKVEVKVGDKWVCDSYVKETPIIQQCQVKSDCPILPECEQQKDLISCNNNLCDYALFSPACKNQLITYQEKVTEIENTKFVPIPSGTNSFFCFFDKTKASCNIGEKQISIQQPSNICSPIKSNDECWQTKLFFNGNSFIMPNAQAKDIGFGIKAELSSGDSIINDKLKGDWSSVGKFTLPDDFLEIKPKDLGNKFIIKDSNEKASFVITNKLGFSIDGGYTIQTQNLALEGGVVLRDEIVPLFLKTGDNEITYDIKTQQFGTIADLIGTFGKVTTDREYMMKSSQDGKQKFLIVTKEVVEQLPQDISKVQPEIIEKIITVEKEVIKTVPAEKAEIPTIAYVIGGIVILFIILRAI